MHQTKAVCLAGTFSPCRDSLYAPQMFIDRLEKLDILDESFFRLPDALYVHTQPREEQGSMESEGPEYRPVVLLALYAIARVLEGNVIPVDVICAWDRGCESVYMHTGPACKHE